MIEISKSLANLATCQIENHLFRRLILPFSVEEGGSSALLSQLPFQVEFAVIGYAYLLCKLIDQHVIRRIDRRLHGFRACSRLQAEIRRAYSRSPDLASSPTFQE